MTTFDVDVKDGDIIILRLMIQVWGKIYFDSWLLRVLAKYFQVSDSEVLGVSEIVLHKLKKTFQTF